MCVRGCFYRARRLKMSHNREDETPPKTVATRHIESSFKFPIVLGDLPTPVLIAPNLDFRFSFVGCNHHYDIKSLSRFVHKRPIKCNKDKDKLNLLPRGAGHPKQSKCPYTDLPKHKTRRLASIFTMTQSTRCASCPSCHKNLL